MRVEKMQWRVSLAALLTIVLVLLAYLNRQPAGAAVTTQDLTPTPSAEDEGLPLSQADMWLYEGRVSRPNGMVWHGDRIYIVCAGDHTVYEVYGTTGVTRTYIGGVHNAYTLYAEEDSSGKLNLWVPDYGKGSLVLITPTEAQTIATEMGGPWGIVYLSDTTFLISNHFSETVESVSRDGERAVMIDDLSLPTGIARDDEYLYVANSGDPERAIEWYTLPTGADNQPAAHVLISGLTDVMGLQFGPDGQLYFAYTENNRGAVGRVDPAECRSGAGCTAEQMERVLVTEMSPPLSGLAFSPDGRLFLHRRYGSSLYWIRLDGEADPAALQAEGRG